MVDDCSCANYQPTPMVAEAAMMVDRLMTVRKFLWVADK
jgi:hypothetical protein